MLGAAGRGQHVQYAIATRPIVRSAGQLETYHGSLQPYENLLGTKAIIPSLFKRANRGPQKEVIEADSQKVRGYFQL